MKIDNGIQERIFVLHENQTKVMHFKAEMSNKNNNFERDFMNFALMLGMKGNMNPAKAAYMILAKLNKMDPFTAALLVPKMLLNQKDFSFNESRPLPGYGELELEEYQELNYIPDPKPKPATISTPIIKTNRAIWHSADKQPEAL